LTDDDPLAFRVLNEVGIIGQLATTMFEQVMPQGMTLAQFSILNHFVRLGGERSPLELARAFQVTKGTMTSTLQRLEARGSIAIRPDPLDGRGKIVSITAAGRKARHAAIAALGPRMADLERGIARETLEMLLPALTELRQVLDQARGAQAAKLASKPPTRHPGVKP
jgi:DNA-binding MarR family transcriptional regulator